MSEFLRVLSLSVLRIVFVGGLLLVLGAGLRWALNPAAAPIISGVAETPLPGIADDGPATPPPPPPVAEAAPTPEPTQTEDAAALIAAARPPGETTVQLLDAGGGPAALDRAEAAILALGYDVINITSSSRDVSATTVYFVNANEPEARALRARDPRFQIVEPNQGLSEGVDLHVLVGPAF